MASKLAFILLILGVTFGTPGSAEVFASPACEQGEAGNLPCDSIPPDLNRQIVSLVRQQIGKTVDRGECWDLAALVLNQTGADWDRKYRFGEEVNPEKDCIYPGDIIQFEGVKIKYTKGNITYEETMGHHTAIIVVVREKGVYVLAHQNTGTSGRKVGTSDLDLKTILKGTFTIYRPVM